MKFFCLGLFNFCSLFLSAQVFLKGSVVDEKNNPIPGTSIYLNNTSVGTRADDRGNFLLIIPHGKYELIASSIGYETYIQALSSNKDSAFLTIRLKLKNDVLETVVVEPYEKDGWEKWGRFFIENFIGQSEFAENCKIRNREVIKFRHSKKTNLLNAYADEPLVIENKSLGYTIFYQLESFTFDFNKHYLIYTGYPFFQAMKGSGNKLKKWGNNRREAYYGSMMHFMRSLYRNQLIQDGFEVRRLQKIPNEEKIRVRAVYAGNKGITKASGSTIAGEINKDSSDYYSKILKQPNEHNIIGRAILPGDSIAYAAGQTTAGLYFENYLLVIYKKKLAPLEYRQQFPKNSTAMQSQLILINGQPVEIEANGSYFNPTDLLSLGYWAWSEKIAAVLPFDYEPSKE